MKFRAGDHVMDCKGRTMRLVTRVKIAGRKGWQASPIINGKVESSRSCYVLDSEIQATQVPEGYQCFLG